jgi:hypothetical protein
LEILLPRIADTGVDRFADVVEGHGRSLPKSCRKFPTTLGRMHSGVLQHARQRASLSFIFVIFPNNSWLTGRVGVADPSRHMP